MPTSLRHLSSAAFCLFAIGLAPAASADIIQGTPVTGTLAEGGSGNAFGSSPVTEPVGPGEEFSGVVFSDSNPFTGLLEFEGFADLREEDILLGFRRTADSGDGGFSREALYEFTFEGLEFDQPVTDVRLVPQNGSVSEDRRPEITAFDMSPDGTTTLTVTYDQGFTFSTGEEEESFTVQFDVAAVPEPSTTLLLLAGGLAAAGVRRRFA